MEPSLSYEQDLELDNKHRKYSLFIEKMTYIFLSLF